MVSGTKITAQFEIASKRKGPFNGRILKVRVPESLTANLSDRGLFFKIFSQFPQR